MNHILVGAGIPFLVCIAIYAIRRCRASLAWLVAAPAAMALGTFWALVPDLPRLAGMQGLYLNMMHDPRTDLFFWHYRMDQIEADSPLAIAGCVALAVLLFGIAWRELRLRERGA